MKNIEISYLELLDEILKSGESKKDRTGTGTISLFGKQIRHDMSLGFPLLTTKKMGIKTIFTELIWFLRGDTNIKYLVDNGCNIWNGDAYKNYIKTMTQSTEITGHTWTPLTLPEFISKIKNDEQFSKKWGELGPIYGHQWRKWGSTSNDSGVDQIKDVIDKLLTNPDSRRIIVNSWNVSEIKNMILPPCHYNIQFYTKKLSFKDRYDIWFQNNYETGMEKNYNVVPDYNDPNYIPTPERKVSLMWNQRSVDFALGLPFNIASYGMLLLIIGEITNMVPDEIVCSLGDCHIYNNHITGVKEQIKRSVLPLPKLELNLKGNNLDEICDNLNKETIKLISYESHDKINYPLSN